MTQCGILPDVCQKIVGVVRRLQSNGVSSWYISLKRVGEPCPALAKDERERRDDPEPPPKPLLSLII